MVEQVKLSEKSLAGDAPNARNDNECVLNQSRGYTSGVSRAARLRFDCGKNDQRQADCGEQLKAAGGEQVFHVDLRLAGCEVERH